MIAFLYEEDRRFEFVITEAALCFRPVDAGTLAAQYDKILSVCTLPSIALAVLPTGASSSIVHAHSFVIYKLADDAAVVTVETYTRELTFTDPQEVQVYERIYESLRSDAIHNDEARRLIAHLRDTTVKR